MDSERYQRNIELWGYEAQERLKESCIMIDGTDELAQKTAISLASLGAGTIVVVGSERMHDNSEPINAFADPKKTSSGRYKTEIIEESLESLVRDTETRIIGIPLPFTSSIQKAFYPDILISSKNRETGDKEKTAHIITQQLHEGFSISWNANDRYALKDYEKTSRIKGYISTIASAIITSLARKHIIMMDDEKPIPDGWNIRKEFSWNLRSNNQSWKEIRGARALVVGVGGIGNFLAADLAAMNLESITLMDDDIVENTNLNRQPYLAGYIGMPKADAVSKKIKNKSKNTKIYTINRRFDNKFSEQDYDIIFSCVDNDQTRIMISEYALKNHITLISGGIGPREAQVTTYVPYNTLCIDCQQNLSASLSYETLHEQEHAGCQYRPEPNIVIPNLMASGLMIYEGINALVRKRTFNEKTAPLGFSDNAAPWIGSLRWFPAYNKEHLCHDEVI